MTLSIHDTEICAADLLRSYRIHILWQDHYRSEGASRASTERVQDRSEVNCVRLVCKKKGSMVRGFQEFEERRRPFTSVRNNLQARSIRCTVACIKHLRVLWQICPGVCSVFRFGLLVDDDRAPPAVHSELVEDLRAVETRIVAAVRTELERLLQYICRAVEHFANDGQPLGGVGVEEGGWREPFDDEGKLPAEIELQASVISALLDIADRGDLPHLELPSSCLARRSGCAREQYLTNSSNKHNALAGYCCKPTSYDEYSAFPKLIHHPDVRSATKKNETQFSLSC